MYLIAFIIRLITVDKREIKDFCKLPSVASFMTETLCKIGRLRRRMKNNKSIFNYVDCIRIFIPDLEKGLEYYHHKLGLQIA